MPYPQLLGSERTQLQRVITGSVTLRYEERPKQFTLDEDIHEIAAVEVKRLHGDVELFQVRTTECQRYLPRYNHQQDTWTLQSDFDGPEKIFPLYQQPFATLTSLANLTPIFAKFSGRTRTKLSK